MQQVGDEAAADEDARSIITRPQQGKVQEMLDKFETKSNQERLSNTSALPPIAASRRRDVQPTQSTNASLAGNNIEEEWRLGTSNMTGEKETRRVSVVSNATKESCAAVPNQINCSDDSFSIDNSQFGSAALEANRYSLLRQELKNTKRDILRQLQMAKQRNDGVQVKALQKQLKEVTSTITDARSQSLQSIEEVRKDTKSILASNEELKNNQHKILAKQESNQKELLAGQGAILKKQAGVAQKSDLDELESRLGAQMNARFDAWEERREEERERQLQLKKGGLKTKIASKLFPS